MSAHTVAAAPAADHQGGALGLDTARPTTSGRWLSAPVARMIQTATGRAGLRLPRRRPPAPRGQDRSRSDRDGSTVTAKGATFADAPLRPGGRQPRHRRARAGARPGPRGVPGGGGQRRRWRRRSPRRRGRHRYAGRRRARAHGERAPCPPASPRATGAGGRPPRARIRRGVTALHVGVQQYEL